MVIPESLPPMNTLMEPSLGSADAGVPAPVPEPVVPEPGIAEAPPAEPVRTEGEGGLARASRLVFIVVAVLAVVSVARAVVVPILLAWVASLVLRRPVDALRKWGIPGPLAAGVVVLAFVVSAGWGVVHLGRPAVEWLTTAVDDAPRLREKFGLILRPAARLTEAASTVGNLAAESAGPRAQPVEVKNSRVASTVFSWTGGLLVAMGETLALMFLILASGDHFLQKVVRAFPRLREKKRAVEISREIHRQVGDYLSCVGLVNAAFGVAVGLALHWIGMPNAAMWGAVAAVANFVPYVGTLAGIAAVTVGGIMVFDTLEMAILPGLVYAGLHLVESNLVTPYALGRRFSLNPVLVFVALILLTWLWGPAGALLAFPLLVTARVIAGRIPSLSAVADLLA